MKVNWVLMSIALADDNVGRDKGHRICPFSMG